MSPRAGDIVHYRGAPERAIMAAMSTERTSLEIDGEPRGARWLPYTMLAYLVLFLVPPALEGAGLLTWAATAAGAAAGAALYVAAFRLHDRRARLAAVAGIVAIGVAFAPSNPAAVVFFAFAGFLVPHAATSRAAYGLLAGLAAVVLAHAWLLALPAHYWLTAAVCAVVAGIVSVNVVRRHQATERLRLAQEEVERLAKVAERERIARDLHDVLGHTMSVVVLKAELAAKLVDRDAERAKAEIRDVERIAREALAEIRETIRGYRTEGLAAELDRARRTLDTVGVALECDGAPAPLDPARENVLALVVREAVTNVVRHAHASVCRIGLSREGVAVRLEIADDGRGAGAAEGNGLRGMRERVEALGGSLRLEGGAGTRLTITLPCAGGGADR
jgi:two-component system sensor histidine kinase DesK